MMPKILAAARGMGRTSACSPTSTWVTNSASASLARGDFDVPAERGRRVLRVHLDAHVAAAALKEAVRQDLA